MVPATEMTPAVLGVHEVLAGALARVERAFEEALASDLPAVQTLVEHLETYRGKMLRPALVIACGLAAGAGAGRRAPSAADITGAHITIAAVCEMVHMATLVHDDVLDEADLRRRGATVNRLRGNEMAVILGDYLFSAAYHLCSTLGSQRAALLIGRTGMTLCSGELLQLHHRENFSIDEPTYFEIVRRKTGSLIGASCRLGAEQSGAGEARAEVFARVGMDLGVAFQIQDDLLDLTGAEAVVGKPVRRDVELGKLTLPLIHHLAHAAPERRGRTLGFLEENSIDTGRRLAEALTATGSFDHARAAAKGLVDRALGVLGELPQSEARALLMAMADQVLSRAA